MVKKHLIENSIYAFYSAIEIHNKPKISYRYESVVILLINSWELILKAFILQQLPNRSIYEGERHTIDFKKAIAYVAEDVNGRAPKSFTPIQENLLLLETYRNEIIHCYDKELDPLIFALISCAVLNYIDFIKEYFSKDILEEEMLYIMPLGFNLPLRLEDLLLKRKISKKETSFANEFIELVINTTKKLSEQGVEKSVLLNFDLHLQNKKNSDLLVSLSTPEKADISIETRKTYRFTTDKSAKAVQLTEDHLFDSQLCTHKGVVEWCKENIVGFKQGRIFNEVKRKIKGIPNYIYIRKMDPRNERSAEQLFYFKSSLDEFKRLYLEMVKHE